MLLQGMHSSMYLYVFIYLEHSNPTCFLRLKSCTIWYVSLSITDYIGLLFESVLMCGGGSFILRRHFTFFLGSDVCPLSGCSFAGEVDDVLDCVCLFHHCRNAHGHCSFLVSSLVARGLFVFFVIAMSLFWVVLFFFFSFFLGRGKY